MRALRRGYPTWLIVFRDMEIMKSKLTELGFNVPRRRYGFGDDSQDNGENNAETPYHHDNGRPRGMSTLLAS